MSGVVVWITGPYHAGKSTLARHVRERMAVPPIVLDEDALREVLTALPFEPGDGDGFYGTVARMAALLSRQGFVVLVATPSSQKRHRDFARRVAPRFIEVHLATPPAAEVGRQAHGLRFDSEATPDESYEPSIEAEVISRGGEDGIALDRVIAAIESVSDGDGAAAR